jgi:hypothetical protein
VNLPRRDGLAVLLLGAVVLVSAAHGRGAEYDEQYTVFLEAGDARPAWPASVFAVGTVRDRFHGDSSFARIAADLRHGDVHPPLYFWIAAVWRRLFGDTLLSLRLCSALFSLAALGIVGLIARRAGIPAALAMLLTLGCYAFVYTGTVARGFALAQLLALFGVFFAIPRIAAPTAPPTGDAPSDETKPARPVIVGLLLGAASFANYLAGFTAVPVIVALACRRLRDGLLAAVGCGAFVAADLVFFLAQRNSRPGQFPPFGWIDGLTRLGKYGAAGIAGGLPLYVPTALQAAVGAGVAAVLAALAVLVVLRWRHIAARPVRALLAGAALATPAGLLLLGLAFDNTPIELRYFTFAVPYLALLVAGALGSLPRPAAAACGGALLALQAASIAGLVTRPETMQPMRAVALEAAPLGGTDTVVLLPRGQDGVGLVGAFLSAAPDDLRVRLVDRTTNVADLLHAAPHAALALLDRDRESRAAIAAVLAGFADDPCWRVLPGGSNLVTFENTCGDGQWVSSTASR